jgi:hypothetical protein
MKVSTSLVVIKYSFYFKGILEESHPPNLSKISFVSMKYGMHLILHGNPYVFPAMKPNDFHYIFL